MSSWRSRIVGLEQHKPSEIADHPQQWRTHPEAQRAALLAQIGEIGVTRPLIIFYSEELGRDATTDGHLRKSLKQDFEWPCLRLDVNDDEARQDLLFGDPLAAMAGADTDVLAQLLAQIETEDAALQAVLDGLAEEVEIAGATELQDASGGGKLQLGDKQRQIKPVLYANQVGIFERALRATGIVNRGEALIFVCQTFLDGHHEEGSFDVQIQGIIEALASS